MTPERLAFRIDDVTEITGLSRATIYRLIAAGKLRTTKIGGCRVVPASSLRTLIEKGALYPSSCPSPDCDMGRPKETA